MDDTRHWDDEPEFDCNPCYETWPSQPAWTRHEHEHHLYCATCDRYFQSDNNLSMVGRPRVLCPVVLAVDAP